MSLAADAGRRIIAAMNPTAEQDFLRHADAYLAALMRKLDGFDPDELEADSAAGVVRMTFADGRSCILNRQAAAHQLWLAEGASAWHFARDPETGTWLDTKGRGPLDTVLAGILSRRLGRAIQL